MKSGSLNGLEPSGPVQACTAIALPLPRVKVACAVMPLSVNQAFSMHRILGRICNPGCTKLYLYGVV